MMIEIQPYMTSRMTIVPAVESEVRESRSNMSRQWSQDQGCNYSAITKLTVNHTSF